MVFVPRGVTRRRAAAVHVRRIFYVRPLRPCRSSFTYPALAVVGVAPVLGSGHCWRATE